jgi:hypothetical protein
MHLPNGEHIVRFSGVQDEHVKKKVQSNGVFNTQEQESHTNGHNGVAQPNGHVSKSNEVHIPLPGNLAPDEVLDTILAAWTILMRRYQRDVFHQFTWGRNDAGNDETQCISTSSLDLMSLLTAGRLKTRVSEVRSKNVASDQATLILNDGTKEEVNYLLQFCIDSANGM